MLRTKTGLLFGFLLAATMACTDSNVIEEQSFTLPESGWAHTNVLEGTWTTAKAIPSGAVVLNIYHTADYKYQNLYLTGTITRDGEAIQSDTFSVQLARPNNGRWLGKSQGESFFVTDTLPYDLSLKPGATYGFQFSQFSREDVLKGVEGVEVLLIEN